MSAGEPSITQLARAKVNLTLHVVRAQKNRYHPLYSLVVFADIGDELSARRAKKFSLKIDGPFAAGLSNGSDNLVLKAARDNAQCNGIHIKAAYHLTKSLPIASGIGGGSADAAAAIRLLAIMNNQPPLSNDWQILEIGSDVPVCHLSKTSIMEGVGEELTPLPGLGRVAAILVNPGVAVSTGAIFSAFDKGGTSSEFALPSGSLLEMARAGRNDLQNIAVGIEPVIQTVLDEIEMQEHCQLVRMSGSGATCFGLFETYENAQNASAAIKRKYPDWWCAPTMLGDTP